MERTSLCAGAVEGRQQLPPLLVTDDAGQLRRVGLGSSGDGETAGEERIQHVRCGRVELYESVLAALGRHRVKFGGYLFHLQFRPVQSDFGRIFSARSARQMQLGLRFSF